MSACFWASSWPSSSFPGRDDGRAVDYRAHVGVTTCLVVIVGATAGAALPLIGKRLGLDPAVFSAPLITTIVDGVGLIIYFNVAVWLCSWGATVEPACQPEALENATR